MDKNLASILIEYLKGEISYEEASRIINKNIKKSNRRRDKGEI